MKRDLIGTKLKTYTITKKLGEGAWACVYEAVNQTDKSKVAIKCLQREVIRRNPKLEELVKTEIKVLKDCNNDNVIKFIDSFHSEFTLFIVVEYCNGGDLENYLLQKKKLTEDEAITFLKQIINGFKGLHLAKAIHRDFKVANVLLHNGVCKIADLGFAKQLEPRKLTTTVLGTSLTMAPEVLDEKPYGMEADIWSLGVVYYQLLFGKYPYPGRTDEEIIRKFMAGPPELKSVKISQDTEDFIKRCLTVDPAKRITWAQIYEHPLFTQKETKLIYGTMQSQININKSTSIYNNQKALNKEIYYPDIKKDLKKGQTDVVSEAVKEAEADSDIKSLVEAVSQKQKVEETLNKYEALYINRRNIIMFPFRFIAPRIAELEHLNANHNLTMFAISKQVYCDLTQFLDDVVAGKNIFNCRDQWTEYVASPRYKEFIKCLKNEKSMAESQFVCYRSDIGNCSNAIKAEFELNGGKTSDKWKALYSEILDGAWFALADYRTSERNKVALLKLMDSLSYSTKQEVNVAAYDRHMAEFDEAASMTQIEAKLQALFA